MTKINICFLPSPCHPLFRTMEPAVSRAITLVDLVRMFEYEHVFRQSCVLVHQNVFTIKGCDIFVSVPTFMV